MNIWLALIVIFLITTWFLETILTLLNLRNQPAQLPKKFADIYSPDKYQDSLLYNKATTRCSLLEKTTSTLLSLGFLLLGGFNALDQIARRGGYGEIITGLLFIGLLLLVFFIIGLPFQLYSTFVIEEGFGFNRTTLKTFAEDTIKACLLAIILGGPFLAAIFWFFLKAGPHAWIYCWLGTTLFSFCLQLLAPTLIMPLFNKFSPLQEGSLKEKISSYVKAQKFSVGGIFTMDGSKRSAKLNAYFTGFGKLRKIVLFDTLVAKLHEKEIVAVLAHEVGHAKCNHLWKNILLSTLHSGLVFFLLSLGLTQKDFAVAFNMEASSIYASLFFFSYLLKPMDFIISLFFNSLSRSHEYEADNYAAKTTGSGAELISALKKLSQENYSNLSPHPLYVRFYYSHPPVRDRIENLERKNA
ncbi:M48 family metallopeptidase [Desulfotalea psychrophila]|uniref:Related to CAAX prenyl protease n=1 Tax=Desulfotalea psychrophila (strain LSv54 / DSM 12343) TaxID=177439 RepID=Q6ANN7_DESPS|nr:M48 family metallopeptidase [Desulfotalea psychrophila]CAG36037.1 related to CAAX prenyl protease [Desulfotalea psychrophila LSv54]